MCRSQVARFFYPYRGISFASPFATYEDLIGTYLYPVQLKASNYLCLTTASFIIHWIKSAANRVVVMSGLFPRPGIESCYKDESVADSPIEIITKQKIFYSLTPPFLMIVCLGPYGWSGAQSFYPCPLNRNMTGWVLPQDTPRITNIYWRVDTGPPSMNIVSEPV